MVAGAGRRIYQYTDGWGAEELRETLAAMYGRSPSDVLITSGATAAMAVLADALIDPGDAVLVEDPGYLGAIKIFATAGATLNPLPMDSEGVSLVALKEALSAPAKPKFFYTMPLFHNPTGQVTSAARRAAVLRALEAAGVPIVQDTVYDRLALGEHAGAIYPVDRALTIGSMSKIAGPGLRIGWIVGSRGVIERLAASKLDGGTNPVCSYVASIVLRSAELAAHVAGLRELYAGKMRAMAQLLASCSFCDQPVLPPLGGFSFWFQWRQGIDPVRVRAEVQARHGVVVTAGQSYGPTSDHGGRLCFSFLSSDEIERGIASIEEVSARLYGRR